MIKIENQGPWNTGSFYVCSSVEGDNKETPYISRLLGHNPESYYQNFDLICSEKL